MHRTLQEEYIAEVNHPIRFINFPKGKTLTDEPPDKIKLRVRSDGYSILKNKIRFKLPLKFDVSSFSIHRFHSDSTRFYVLTRYAKERLNDELDKKNNALNILEISPDTIYFSLTDLITKKVKVSPEIINLNEFIQIQHKQNGAIMIEPDSVQVSGPAFIVDTLKSIFTKQLDLKMMTDTTTYRVKLSKYEDFSIKEDRVRVIIPVDQYTENEYKIPIGVINVPDTVLLKLFPSVVTIQYHITLSYFDSIKEANFKPFIDYMDIKSEDTPFLQVHLNTLPSYVHSIKIKPKNVEILRERNYNQSGDNWRDR